MKPTYFDFTVKDLDKAKSFFEHVFDWRFEKFPMPYDYYRIQAGAEDEPGIDGGIGAIADTPIAQGKPLTQVTIPVPSVDDCIAASKKPAVQSSSRRCRSLGSGGLPRVPSLGAVVRCDGS